VQPIELDLSKYNGYTPVEMLSLTEFPRIGELPYFLTLGPYSFYWFKLQQTPAPIGVRTAPLATGEVDELPAVFAGTAWDILLEGNVRTLIERDLLIPYLQRQRWFGGKARRLHAARIVDWAIFRPGAEPAFLAIAEVDYEDGAAEQYFLTLALRSDAAADEIVRQYPNSVLARVTGARKGVLFDAALDHGIATDLLAAIEQRRGVATRRGTIRAVPTAAFAELRGPSERPLAVAASSAEQSNTSIRYGIRLILKLFRKIEPGLNPDFEITRHLSDKVRFERVPPLAGSLEYVRPGVEDTTLGMLQKLVYSQADGWQNAVEEMGRYFERTHGREFPAAERGVEPWALRNLAEQESSPVVLDTVGGYLETAATLGRRTAEMHLALAEDSSDPAFAPEPFDHQDLQQLARDMGANAAGALRLLEDRIETIPEDVRHQARAVVDARAGLLERLGSLATLPVVASKIRVHGDYHLGQVLWAEEDFYILDFEGEPARPLSQRRAKQLPLKDVAGMLRSYSYAAFAGLFAHSANRPDEFSRLEPWAWLWQKWAAATFFLAYLTTTGDAPFLPTDRVQFDRLLEAYVLDKALYELRYELNNRPEWVRIPLWGILPLIGEPG
jgi:maltose alpha-D-glucosyltransferase / alpha-amylase